VHDDEAVNRLVKQFFGVVETFARLGLMRLEQADGVAAFLECVGDARDGQGLAGAFEPLADDSNGVELAVA
jgi:hypothetical protein